MEIKNLEKLEQQELPTGQRVLKLKTSDRLYFYWHEIKVFFLFFAILELARVLLSFASATIFTAKNILPGIILIFEVFVLIGLSARFAQYRDIKKSFLAPAFFALLTGFTAAIIKLIQYLEPWAFYNLILEPGIMMVWAFLVAIIVNLVILVTRKIKIIFYNYKKIRSDLNIN